MGKLLTLIDVCIKKTCEKWKDWAPVNRNIILKSSYNNSASVTNESTIPKSASTNRAFLLQIYAYYNTNGGKSCILVNGYYRIDDRKHEGRKRNVKTLP
jgi:hypothetical protein